MRVRGRGQQRAARLHPLTENLMMVAMALWMIAAPPVLAMAH